MNINTSIFFFKKVATGFRTKADVQTEAYKNDEGVLLHIKNKEFGLFIIKVKNPDITIQGFTEFLKGGIPDGMHGGNEESVFDTWYETEIGKVSIIGIPKTELMSF